MAYSKERKTFVCLFVQDRPVVMNGEPRVFTNKHKGKDEDVDLIAVSECFNDETAYDVRIFKMDKMSAAEILQFFSKFAKDNEFAKDKEVLNASEYDKYVFVFLSTLKSEECIFVGNGEGLHMAKVYDEIKTSTFMAGKPKVFIIQADDEGMVKDLEVPQAPQADRKLPQDADRLIIISTLPQILANIVDKDLGQPVDLPTPNLESLICAVYEKKQRLPISKPSQASFLIQAFVAVIKQCREDDKEVFTNTPYILKMVDERLDPFRSRFPHILFPLPLVTSTLTKPLKFQ